MQTTFKKIIVFALLGMFLVQSSANIKTMAALSTKSILIGSDLEEHPVIH